MDKKFSTSTADHIDLTALLRQSVAGDEAAREQLWRRVHDRLRVMARNRLAQESAASGLDATELVHEVFFKLDSLTIEPRDRLHFLALAARAMRQVLIEQARARRRDKRGGGLSPVTLLTRHGEVEPVRVVDVLDLEQALAELEKLDERKARAIELSYFGGLTDEEVASTLEISSATVKRDLRTARAWLGSALK
ncbi:MAG: sigma-70 family RNA polymerase sigma factor [Wenzhouxiangella sp.]|nr:sigma-70 family RNA polymerase sigma factor [Wenzhouxiangella sp.]MCH8476319.1 sigma-70 family RNA polymerase sigma factor [Wenzhouxiangella sp.]